ncbi:glycosyltransferase family 2 protein [Imperialibacter roseus]|uniref:Glycosyltransferase family 2 protein n=1 Tax=Imperialibacter roseus TaxID=1324217 RepID=A0ABZ0IRU9_9BACT|nr:glycosyltransferase family 2 protein [Imperialibacter roseus]WOK06307.1 glycosyltransferase family 2 protein [Imperialibacter roseus]
MPRRVMNERKVSVAMATFNGGAFLAEQINSIVNQSLPPSEIVVCDDLSQDNSAEILKSYESSGYLRYLPNELRLGIIENFKKAVSLTDAQNYIAFSDQDDIWMPHKLETLLHRMSEIDDGITPALIYSDLAVIDRKGKVIRESFWNELGQDTYVHSFETLLYGNFVTGCSMLINPPMRKLFLEMPSNAPMHDYWIALIGYSFGIVSRIDLPLVKYRKHESNAAFSASHRKKTAFKRRLQNLKFLVTGDQDYLKSETAIASLFLEKFKPVLSEKHRTMLLRLSQLRNRSFLKKKVSFHLALRGRWRKEK